MFKTESLLFARLWYAGIENLTSIAAFFGASNLASSLKFVYRSAQRFIPPPPASFHPFRWLRSTNSQSEKPHAQYTIEHILTWAHQLFRICLVLFLFYSRTIVARRGQLGEPSQSALLFYGRPKFFSSSFFYFSFFLTSKTNSSRFQIWKLAVRRFFGSKKRGGLSSSRWLTSRGYIALHENSGDKIRGKKGKTIEDICMSTGSGPFLAVGFVTREK